MNLIELKEALRLKLPSVLGKVLLISKGAVPEQNNPRLVFSKTVPEGNEPLKFALIVFIGPFDQHKARALNRWLIVVNRPGTAIHTNESMADVMRTVLEHFATQNRSAAQTGPEKLTDRATLEEMLRNRCSEKMYHQVPRVQTASFPLPQTAPLGTLPALPLASVTSFDQRLVPQPRVDAAFAATLEWVHQRVKPQRHSDQAEAERLAAIANRYGLSHITLESILTALKHLVQNNDIVPARRLDKTIQRVTADNNRKPRRPPATH